MRGYRLSKTPNREVMGKGCRPPDCLQCCICASMLHAQLDLNVYCESQPTTTTTSGTHPDNLGGGPARGGHGGGNRQNSTINRQNKPREQTPRTRTTTAQYQCIADWRRLTPNTYVYVSAGDEKEQANGRPGGRNSCDPHITITLNLMQICEPNPTPGVSDVVRAATNRIDGTRGPQRT